MHMRAKLESGTFGGSTLDESARKCQGDYCFSAKFDTNVLDSEVAGCVTLFAEPGGHAKKGATGKEPIEPGCIEALAPNIEIQTCFARNEKELKKLEEEEEREDEDDEKKEKEDEKDEEEEEEEEQSEKEKAKAVDDKLKTEKEKEQLFDEKGKQREKELLDTGAAKHAAHKETKDEKVAEAVASNNAAIVAVFVVLIIVIILIGLAWKFELPKKIFASRYQTVAG
jgi:cobalamin biosynthesis Mg chelatase CobN